MNWIEQGQNAKDGIARYVMETIDSLWYKLHEKTYTVKKKTIQHGRGKCLGTIEGVYTKNGSPWSVQIQIEAKGRAGQWYPTVTVITDTGKDEKTFAPTAGDTTLIKWAFRQLNYGKPKMSSLRKKLVRLAHTNPELKPHLLPLLKSSRTAAQHGMSFIEKNGSYITLGLPPIEKSTYGFVTVQNIDRAAKQMADFAQLILKLLIGRTGATGGHVIQKPKEIAIVPLDKGITVVAQIYLENPQNQENIKATLSKWNLKPQSKPWF